MSDDQLIKAVEYADLGLEPPPFGSLKFEIMGAPVSVQSSKAVKSAYLRNIKNILSKYKYVLTGQIMLDVTWLVPAKSRYETDARADIDNCLKPILDAFTGPDGLFIDDCQIKGLYICWRHIESEEERLLFEFNFDPIQWCNKDGLAFLALDRGLCCLVDINWSKPIREIWIKTIKSGEHYKTKLEKLGTSYLALAGMTGGNQPFHRTRTTGFPVLSEDEFIHGLKTTDSSPDPD